LASRLAASSARQDAAPTPIPVGSINTFVNFEVEPRAPGRLTWEELRKRGTHVGSTMAMATSMAQRVGATTRRPSRGRATFGKTGGTWKVGRKTNAAAVTRAGGPEDPLRNLDKVVGEDKKEETKKESGALYASDDDSEGFFIRKEMPKDQKDRLKKEYIGLGGSEGTPLSSNYFLNIIIFVTVLVLLSYFTGAI